MTCHATQLQERPACLPARIRTGRCTAACRRAVAVLPIAAGSALVRACDGHARTRPAIGVHHRTHRTGRTASQWRVCARARVGACGNGGVVAEMVRECEAVAVAEHVIVRARLVGNHLRAPACRCACACERARYYRDAVLRRFRNRVGGAWGSAHGDDVVVLGIATALAPAPRAPVVPGGAGYPSALYVYFVGPRRARRGIQGGAVA
jgi:hypothetical protein